MQYETMTGSRLVMTSMFTLTLKLDIMKSKDAWIPFGSRHYVAAVEWVSIRRTFRKGRSRGYLCFQGNEDSALSNESPSSWLCCLPDKENFFLLLATSIFQFEPEKKVKYYSLFPLRLLSEPSWIMQNKTVSDIDICAIVSFLYRKKCCLEYLLIFFGAKRKLLLCGFTNPQAPRAIDYRSRKGAGKVIAFVEGRHTVWWWWDRGRGDEIPRFVFQPAVDGDSHWVPWESRPGKHGNNGGNSWDPSSGSRSRCLLLGCSPLSTASSSFRLWLS